MKKIRVGAVNYLNTKPMLYGIKRHQVMKEIELLEDYPSRIARMLIDDEVDVGLIPVAATLALPEWHIVSDYGIGCDGAVASVCIFSEQPLENIKRIYLDYQSRTSVNLAKVLLREYWKMDPELIDAKGEDFKDKIENDTAGVVIGDRALEQRLRSKYIYDLGEAWKAHTGLPFIFAAWISNKPLPEAFRISFNEANREGLEHLDEVIKENPYPLFNLVEYYRKYIQYEIDSRKLEGMKLFLSKIKQTDR